MSFYLRFFLNRQLSHSEELASKKESNCNIMITGFINHMILIRVHLHIFDKWPLTWSQHIIIHMISTNNHSYDLNTWPTNFILISSHQYQHLSYCIFTLWLHLDPLLIMFTLLPHPDLIIIVAHIFNKFTNLAWASSSILEGLQIKLLLD